MGCAPVAQSSREKDMTIVWTKHAEERQQEWQRTLGITRHDVEELLKNPEQVVPGRPRGADRSNPQGKRPVTGAVC